jgi:hypothetical protein
MPPDKTIQPSDEVENEGKDNLINVAPHIDEQKSPQPRVLSPDELDKADNIATQQANQLIAEEEIKEISKNGITVTNDMPYSHVSHADFARGGIPGKNQIILKWIFTILFILFLAYLIINRINPGIH